MEPATRASAPSPLGEHRSGPRPWVLTATAAALSAAFTILVLLVRPFDVAYRSPAMHISVETVAAVVAAVAAYLFVGRYRLNGTLGDLVLALSLLVLAIGSLCFSVLPAILSGSDDIARFSTWAQVISGLLGAGGFAIAAFSERRLRLSRPWAVLLAASFAAVLLLVAGATRLLATHLPLLISPTLSPVRGGHHLVTGRPLGLAAQGFTMALFIAASAGFLRRAERTGDQLVSTLSAASAVGAFAALNYVVFPSLYSQWIYSGDILRFAFSALILAGVARELNGYWRDLAGAAVLEERRRIARELHDGLAQELAFIASQSKLLGPGELELRLASAADRALEESRRAIDALTKPLDEPLDVTVARAADEVATRVGANLTLELEPGIRPTPEVRDALRRIVREATINATRHGHASTIRIVLERNGVGLRLLVEDDGTGFEPSRSSDGFGLISIRERAQRLGGEAVVRSAPGGGTTVEVDVP